MTLRVLVADDEPLARNELIYLLQQIGDIEIVGEASTGEDTLIQASETNPDTIFLDIEMPHMSGLEVAAKIMDWKNPPTVVFATAFDEYAIQAFEVNAIDYVLKPFEENRVRNTIERIRSRKRTGGYSDFDIKNFLEQIKQGTSSPKINKIAVQDGETIVLLNTEEIFYISREGREILIHTNNRQYESKCSIHLLEAKLEKFSFFRTHRAYLVNLNHVDQLMPWFNGAYTLIIKDAQRSKIPVSRSYVKSLKEVLGII